MIKRTYTQPDVKIDIFKNDLDIIRTSGEDPYIDDGYEE